MNSQCFRIKLPGKFCLRLGLGSPLVSSLTFRKQSECNTIKNKESSFVESRERDSNIRSQHWDIWFLTPGTISSDCICTQVKQNLATKGHCRIYDFKKCS